MTEYLLYTSEKCPACETMKSALKKLAIECREIKLKNGMVLLPDVRGIPTLVRETEGRRTTLCSGWPGSLEVFVRILKAKGIERGEK